MLYSEKGLTVFELVFVIFLFSILWLVQLSCLGSLSAQFREAFEKNVAGSVHVGIASYFVDPQRGDIRNYPPVLDTLEPGDCSDIKPCFQNVLAGGVTVLWKKIAPFEYLGPSENHHVWKYNPLAGEFNLLT